MADVNISVKVFTLSVTLHNYGSAATVSCLYVPEPHVCKRARKWNKNVRLRVCGQQHLSSEGKSLFLFCATMV